MMRTRPKARAVAQPPATATTRLPRDSPLAPVESGCLGDAIRRNLSYGRDAVTLPPMGDTRDIHMGDSDLPGCVGGDVTSSVTLSPRDEDTKG